MSSCSSSTRAWLRAFLPHPLSINSAERWRSVIGACIGILFAAVLSRYLNAMIGAPAWLVAPVGASAVLVFAVPSSPLAQPWAVFGGNTVSALAGVACALWIPDPSIAASVAVATAIAAMFALRCLHPPGGAMALLAVLTHSHQFGFVLFPAATNTFLLVAAGLAYNAATGRNYPHVQSPAKAKQEHEPRRFATEDLDAVLANYNQIIDISRDDLEDILQLTEMQAMKRQLGEIRCEDIMSRDLITVQYATPLDHAWRLMQRHRIKALPVVDSHQRILGIVTRADFMRHAKVETHEDFGTKLKTLLRKTTSVHTNKPEVVGQIMASQVRVASADRHIVELVPIFSKDGHHHIPIIDADRKLVGIITESDFVRALYRMVSVDPRVSAAKIPA
jgi:CBS domain-containing membrane protein